MSIKNLFKKSVKRTGLVLLSAVLVYGIAAPAIFNSVVHAAPANLINNPLVESANPSNANAPVDWQVGNWGTNTFTSSYLNTGPTGDTNSVEINMTQWTSGDAKWYFNPVAVTAGTEYTFSDSYESNVATDVVAQFATATNAYSYQDLGTQPASTSWNQATGTFTVPSAITSVTIFHTVSGVGSLVTSNFSLVSSSTPSVNVTSPSANGTVSGKTVALAANASDSNGVASVQFKVNGANVGSPDTTAPYNYNWDSTTVTNGTYNVTAVATNAENVSTTSAAVVINVNNAVPLGTNLIANPLLETSNANAPVDWQVGNWGTNTFTSSYLNTGPTGDTNSVEINMTQWTSGDAKWYFNPVAVTAGTEYTFSDSYESNVATSVVIAYSMSDGSTTYVNIGTPAASTSWNTFSDSFVAPTGAIAASVYHSIQSVGYLTIGDFSLAAATGSTVTVTAPVASTDTSTPYSGKVTLTAAASDNSGVSNVQFEVDGANVGSPITAAPYIYTWDSTTVSNGAHSVTAVVTNSSNKTTASVPVSIEVSNTTGTSSSANLIPNPLMNIASPTTPTTAPQDWSVDTWGTNTFTASYLNTGSAGDSHSVEINMTKWTSGDAKWVFTPQNVSLDTQYSFSDFYESNVQTLVDAVFLMSDGTYEYQIIGVPSAASTWTQFSSKFSVPEGATNLTIYHSIQSVGTLTIDNASMTTYVPTGFSSPMVSLTFDDGYETEYTNGLPILQQYGMLSTQFIITDLIGKTGYMTAAQLKTFSGDGDEMASHTVTHDDLTQETAAQLSKEMAPSQATIKADTGIAPTDLAYPMGLYNANVVNAAKAVYTSARGVESGLNSVDNFNPYDLKVEDIYTTTTTAQVADWVAQAQATNTWLIFVYHGVDANTSDPVDGDIWDVTPTELSAQLAAIQASGVKVETLSQGLASVETQLGISTTPVVPVSHTVTFNANGGTGTMAAETSSSAKALTTNKFKRTGFTFTGWNTAANGTGTTYANGASYTFSASITLYAQWK